MAKKALVVVESPSKAKSIQKYLGREYIVRASVGHIKDLPKAKLGVDPEDNFAVTYQVIPGKKKVLDDLHKASDQVPLVYLATDPDREGEAIAWHIKEEIAKKGQKFHRLLFNSITKEAVQEALKTPAVLDKDKYSAQQARRILDRLVGYKISPLLWDKVKRGISAGRVQSVALRLIVEREKEIKEFKAIEYWKLEAIFGKTRIEFPANLFKINSKNFEISSKDQMDGHLAAIKSRSWKISAIEKKERSRRPQPPFITSTLQQDAARRLGFSAKKTMMLAQRLYEGVDLGDLGTSGLITYMRTDSVRVEPAALEAVRVFIGKQYGKTYLPEVPNLYKTKKSAQDAHEAIRPTSMDYLPEQVKSFLENDEFRLYQLIWNRFVGSQMTPAVYDQTSVDVLSDPVSASAANKDEYQFRVTGSVIKFPGFSVLYTESTEEGDSKSADKESEEVGILNIADLKEGDAVEGRKWNPTQHFTQPPPRYSDASLVKELEEKGIGRPSTYATILSNLQDREYVEKRQNRYYPSELGTVVSDLLVASFPDVLNVEFTAGMENQLDEIEEGKIDLKKALSGFWKPFEKTLEKAKKQMKNVKAQEVPTDVDCERCGKKMVIKWGKMGSFLACSNYPECKNTQDFRKDDDGVIKIVPKEFTNRKCEKCGKPMVVKSGKFGKFLACSDYPNCKSTAPYTLGIQCPKCKEGEIAQRQSRFKRVFYSCERWPKCDYSLWDKPVEKECPDCKSPLLVEKVTKRIGHFYKCPNKECSYMEVLDSDPQANPKSATL